MNKFIKTVICICLIILGVLYDLYIDDYSSNNSSVYYDNVVATDNVSINNVEGLNIDFNADLYAVGDYYEVIFDVVNPTSVDMEISQCIYNKDNYYLNSILEYDDGTLVSVGDIVKSGESVRVKYIVSYENELINTDTTIDSSFYIDYEQVLQLIIKGGNYYENE